MKIIIPSLGRSGTASSMKWISLSDRPVVFAVHEDEALSYAKAYPNTEIMILSEECRRHTGKVRQEIMRRIRSPFIFCDDDIRISLKSVTSVDAVFDILEHHIKCGASMAGLGQQLFSNMQMEKCELINNDPYVIRNHFVATVYAINPLDFDTCPLEKLPVYEDISLVLHSILYGGGTITSYCATHSNVSPPTGGCNQWRNEIITLESLLKLVELYPGICSIKDTSNTTHSQNIGLGLRTAWSKIRKLS